MYPYDTWWSKLSKQVPLMSGYDVFAVELSNHDQSMRYVMLDKGLQILAFFGNRELYFSSMISRGSVVLGQ